MDEIKQEVKKDPPWITILKWIVGIWAVATLGGVIIEVFMFFTIGGEIDMVKLPINIAIVAIALIVVLKLGMIKYKKSNKQKPQEKNEEIILNNSSFKKMKYFDYKNLKKVGMPKLDNILKVSVIIGIILVAVALFYYFLIRPKQEERAYTDCLSVLKDSEEFDINTSYGKSSLDVCTKSRGAENIRIEREFNIKQEEVKKQAEEAMQKEKELMFNELIKLSIINIKSEWNNLGNGIYFKGKIKNDNNFDVRNIKVKIEIFSDKNSKNKIDDKEFIASDVFYAKSTKDFSFFYYTNSKNGFSYYYKITGAETDASLDERSTNAISSTCNSLSGNVSKEICELNEKATAYQQILELKQKQEETLQNQLNIINVQIDKLNYEINFINSKMLDEDTSVFKAGLEQKRTELEDNLRQKMALIKQIQVEQARYEELLERVEKQITEMGGEIYEVREGDTIKIIASKFGIPVNTILWANKIEVVDSIVTGDKLFIPKVAGILYTVKSDDDIESIAKKYKANKNKIIDLNNLPSDGQLEIGQEIVIPYGQ